MAELHGILGYQGQGFLVHVINLIVHDPPWSSVALWHHTGRTEAQLKKFFDNGIGKNGPLTFLYHVYELVTKEGMIGLAGLVWSSIDGLFPLLDGPRLRA
jgi:hypothetical protein